MNDFSESGRDMDTFRPIIGPRWNEEAEADDAPRVSWWMSIPIVIGALMGMIVVGLVYIEDHPEVPVAAREGTNAARAAARAPAAPPPASKPAAVAAAPQPEPKGFVAIVGPQGARVFDGDTIVGTVPMLHATTPGTHVIRVQQVPSNRSQTFNIVVRDQETTPVIVAANAPKARGGKRRGK